MASGPGVQRAKDALDMWLGGGGVVRLWLVAPAFDGTGGTESVPSGGAPTATFSPAVAGTGGQIAKADASASPVFPGVPDASTAIVALSVHDPSDDSIISLDTSWTAPGTGWTAGQSPTFPVSVVFVPVP